MLPQQLICIFLLMLSYLRETKIETKTDTPYRKYVYHSLAAAPWRHVSQSQWHLQQHAIWLRAWKHFDFLDDVLNAAWVISKEQREWESDGQTGEREGEGRRERGGRENIVGVKEDLAFVAAFMRRFWFWFQHRMQLKINRLFAWHFYLIFSSTFLAFFCRNFPLALMLSFLVLISFFVYISFFYWTLFWGRSFNNIIYLGLVRAKYFMAA